MLKEFSLITTKALAEDLSDFLMDNGAYSVSIEDADADSAQEKAALWRTGNRN